MRFALTTFDNPYDPFEQFTQWFMFDEEKGYHTTAYLGRIARTSDQLSDEENNKEVERAIDMLEDFLNGLFMIIVRRADEFIIGNIHQLSLIHI